MRDHDQGGEGSEGGRKFHKFHKFETSEEQAPGTPPELWEQAAMPAAMKGESRIPPVQSEREEPRQEDLMYEPTSPGPERPASAAQAAHEDQLDENDSVGSHTEAADSADDMDMRYVEQCLAQETSPKMLSEAADQSAARQIEAAEQANGGCKTFCRHACVKIMKRNDGAGGRPGARRTKEHQAPVCVPTWVLPRCGPRPVYHRSPSKMISSRPSGRHVVCRAPGCAKVMFFRF